MSRSLAFESLAVHHHVPMFIVRHWRLSRPHLAPKASSNSQGDFIASPSLVDLELGRIQDMKRLEGGRLARESLGCMAVLKSEEC